MERRRVHRHRTICTERAWGAIKMSGEWYELKLAGSVERNQLELDLEGGWGMSSAFPGGENTWDEGLLMWQFWSPKSEDQDTSLRPM